VSTRKKPTAERVTESVPTSQGKGAAAIGLSMASPAIRDSVAIPDSKNFGDPNVSPDPYEKLRGTHINGVPFEIWAKGMPDEIVSRISYSLTDEGLAIQDRLVARERELPFGGAANDPDQKKILQRGDELDAGLGAEFSLDPLKEVLAPYQEPGYAYKFLSDMCVRHLGMRGYEVVKDKNGDPVKYADLTVGRIPQRIADARRKKYVAESDERVKSMPAKYGDAVSELEREAKDLGMTVLGPGEARGNFVNDDTGARINIG
jgi:hypothetical protein